MAADPNNAVYFPATLLFLLRPLSAASRVAHVFWAAAFAVLAFSALRKLGLSRPSAAVSALAVAVSGPAMTLASLPTSGWALAFFLPLLAAGIGATGPAGIAGTGLVFGLAVLAGEPAIAGEMLALGVLFLILERRRGWRAAAGGIACGVAIALPQIVGAAGLIGDTVRRGGLAVASGAGFYSVRPLRFLAFVWPGLFGDVHSPSAAGFWGARFFDAGAPYVSSLAIGTATLALMPAAARDRRGRSFLVLSGVAALLSLGRHFPGGARVLSLPGVSFVRYPEKWLFFAALSAVAAAGFGLDRIRSGDRVAVRRVAAASFLLAAASGIALAWLRAEPGAAWSALLRSRIANDSVALARAQITDAIARDLATTAAFAAGLLLAAAGFGRRPRRVAVAAASLLLVDLASRTWNSVPLAPASTFDDPPDAVRAVAARGGRLFFDRETQIALDPLRPMAPAIWGIAFAGNNDIDRFSPRRSFFFGRALASMDPGDPRRADLLRLADVRSVSSPSGPLPALGAPGFPTSPHRWLYRLEGGERFRFFPSATRAGGEEEARRLLLDPRLDRRAALVVEGAGPAGSPSGEAEIRPGRRRADREEVEVESPGGYLFRSETFDPHWKVRIDGRPAPLLPADFAFQAVAVPEGRHRVEFRYSDPVAAAAMFVSLAALLASALALSKTPRRA